ncbi:MAG: preprotein translocase subunit SecA [bacterium]|nr:preprotein translocase subunit SecA [bacterium]
MSWLTKIFGDPNKKYLAKLQPLVEKINELEPQFVSLDDAGLKAKTEEFKKRLQEGEKLDDLLPESFAATRETSKRVLNQRHFDVQLLGGIVLHQGQIAEMRTGEGKTLVATLPSYLNALTGQGVHVVTVNDYLARRDCVWMGQIHYALGLTVGCITHEAAFVYDPNFQQTANSKQQTADELGSFKVFNDFLRPVERKEAYAADILYGTNNEYGFDYLRDNMVAEKEQMVQRGHHFAVIDEVDSILIDEARTPLIISAPAEESEELYHKFAILVRQLKENEDYNIDEKMRAATLTEAGIVRMEKALGVKNIYDEGGLNLVHHLEQALRASVLYKRDRDYVVNPSADGGEVIIVDEFTGRLMPGRRWSEGLHQAVEAKEGVKIERESHTLATVTFQNYFRMYKKLSGMTGTALTESEEFHKIYGLEVVNVPTNKPMVRQDMSDRVYKNEQAKFKAVVAEIKQRHEKGQPVLVGTISIEKNEILSQMLEREGVPHNLLNAKNHEKEGEIIAQAGRLGAVTIATNMAGRGVDIILGGNPALPDEADKVRKVGGLHVLGTERHEARRIDNQLRGRAGRQGDSGSSQFYLSLEDDLMRIFAGDRVKSLMERFNIPDDVPIENRLVSRSIEAAQNKVEQHNFDIRKHLLEYDDVLNKHREGVYRRRKNILGSESQKEAVLEMIEKEIEQVVLFHTTTEDENSWNTKEIGEVIKTIFPLSDDEKNKLTEFKKSGDNKMDCAESRTFIIQYLKNLALARYEEMEKKLAESMRDEQITRKIEKGMYLRAIDTLWVEHLDAIDHLRRGIGLRGYGQRDPLVEYKKEAYRMFIELGHFVDKQVVYSIYKVGIASQMAPSLLQRQGLSLSAPQKTMEKGEGLAESFQKTDQSASVSTPIQFQPKVGRNDPCPCGAKKPDGTPIKYKHCHGK